MRAAFFFPQRVHPPKKGGENEGIAITRAHDRFPSGHESTARVQACLDTTTPVSFAPAGATGRSHGWSEAEPVVSLRSRSPAPDGAEDGDE